MSDETKLIEIGLNLFHTGMSIVAGMVVWSVKRSKDHVDRLNDKVIVLESIAVNEDKVRNIVRDEIKDLRQDTKELRDSVSKIHAIVTEIRIEQAKKSGEEPRRAD
jgi:hypothetical protein